MSVVSFVVGSCPCLPLLVGPRHWFGLGFWLRFACGLFVVFVVVGVVVGVIVVCCGRLLVVVIWGGSGPAVTSRVAPGVASRRVSWGGSRWRG